MKKVFFQFGLATLLLTAFAAESCKNKKADADTDTTTTTTTDNTTPTTTAPTISGDEELRRGVTDATKDFPTVQARVEDSVVILSGTVKKEDNQRLTQTLNSLRPKRIDRDNLKVQ